MPAHPRFTLGCESVHMLKIVDFLRYVVDRDQLGIADYLGKMGQDPFFLVAATGLGKTVAVPVHLLIRVMEQIGADLTPQPRVWVVEPRIPIALDQTQFMNTLWQEFTRREGSRKLPPLFGCVSSVSGSINKDAPIQFVTTGIFELMAKSGDFTPERDRIIIDEAHVTIEQNPGVELGISLARAAGVNVDFMSATVDTTTLATDLNLQTIIRADAQRHVVWKVNLWKSLDAALPDLVEGTLINPDPANGYFPFSGEYAHADAVVGAVFETGRSHGMLVTVNSYAGDQSDIVRLANMLQQRFPDLPVLQLASEVVRDAKRSQEFRDELKRVEAARQNYVILATSVVEMGITFPTLDYVVTMDSGYSQETMGDTTFPVVAPLGVNSLLQRIGRVGRRRPGIAYIAQEVGAFYTELEDNELNAPGALAYEAISFPLANAPLMPLAYYACTQEWEDVDTWVANLALPSNLHENADRMAYLGEQFDTLQQLGLTDEHDRLTPLGESMERWIGRVDLAYAVQLQRRFEEGCDLHELMFWIVAAALSDTPLTSLRQQYGYFLDYSGSDRSITYPLEVWRGNWHEDVAAFTVVAIVTAMAPKFLFEDNAKDVIDESNILVWCNMIGLDSRNLLKAGKAITNLWQLFCKINRTSPEFAAVFGAKKAPALAALPWLAAAKAVKADHAAHHQLMAMPGVIALSITLDRDNPGYFAWYDAATSRMGSMTQDDTPLELGAAYTYTARLVPGRRKAGDETNWRITHLGAYSKEVTVPARRPHTLHIRRG